MICSPLLPYASHHIKIIINVQSHLLISIKKRRRISINLIKFHFIDLLDSFFLTLFQIIVKLLPAINEFGALKCPQIPHTLNLIF